MVVLVLVLVAILPLLLAGILHLVRRLLMAARYLALETVGGLEAREAAAQWAMARASLLEVVAEWGHSIKQRELEISLGVLEATLFLAAAARPHKMEM